MQDTDAGLAAPDGTLHSDDQQAQRATSGYFAATNPPAPAPEITEAAILMPATPTAAAQTLDEIETGTTAQYEPVVPPPSVVQAKQAPDNFTLGTLLLIGSGIFLLVALLTTLLRRRSLRA